jgi:hypothetical protein
MVIRGLNFYYIYTYTLFRDKFFYMFIFYLLNFIYLYKYLLSGYYLLFNIK